MTPHKPIRIVVSPDLRAAIDRHCQTAGVEMSAYIRELIVADLGKPELLETLRTEGAPKRKPTQAQTARRKPQKKSKRGD